MYIYIYIVLGSSSNRCRMQIMCVGNVGVVCVYAQNTNRAYDISCAATVNILIREPMFVC